MMGFMVIPQPTMYMHFGDDSASMSMLEPSCIWQILIGKSKVARKTTPNRDQTQHVGDRLPLQATQ